MNVSQSKLRALHELIWPHLAPQRPNLPTFWCSSSKCFISGCMWYCYTNNSLIALSLLFNLSRVSSFIVDLVMREKFTNCIISVAEAILTSVF